MLKECNTFIEQIKGKIVEMDYMEEAFNEEGDKDEDQQTDQERRTFI